MDEDIIFAAVAPHLSAHANEWDKLSICKTNEEKHQGKKLMREEKYHTDERISNKMSRARVCVFCMRLSNVNLRRR